jgi:hypothetical protein
VPAGKLANDAASRPSRWPRGARGSPKEAGLFRRAVGIGGLGSIFTTAHARQLQPNEVIHLLRRFEPHARVEPARGTTDVIEGGSAVPLAHALELVWRGELRDAKSAR